MAQVTPGTNGVRGWRQDRGPGRLEECECDRAPHLERAHDRVGRS
jgi:hypothetical protein